MLKRSDIAVLLALVMLSNVWDSYHPWHVLFFLLMIAWYWWDAPR